MALYDMLGENEGPCDDGNGGGPWFGWGWGWKSTSGEVDWVGSPWRESKVGWEAEVGRGSWLGEKRIGGWANPVEGNLGVCDVWPLLLYDGSG